MAVNLRFDNQFGIESAVGSRCTSSDVGVLPMTRGSLRGASIVVAFVACGIFGQNTQLRRTPPARKACQRPAHSGYCCQNGPRPGGAHHYRRPRKAISWAGEGPDTFVFKSPLAVDYIPRVSPIRSLPPACARAGVMRNAVMRFFSRRSTRKRKPWKVKVCPGSGIDCAS
jgi:hypothetical protein